MSTVAWSEVLSLIATSLIPRLRISGEKDPTHDDASKDASIQSQQTEITDLSRLESLPLEILHTIFLYLPQESKVVLGLVSKALLTELGHFWPVRKSPGENGKAIKFRLLTLLERDLPHMVLCEICMKLYEWRNSGLIGSHLRYLCPARHTNWLTHKQKAIMCSLHDEFSVYREAVRLAIRHETQGPEWGIPAIELTHVCSGTLRQTYSPKVVKGQLIIHSTCKFNVATGVDVIHQLTHMRDIVSNHSNDYLIGPIICNLRHLKQWIKLQEKTESPEPRSRWNPRVDPRNPRCKLPLRCLYCATDIRVSVQLGASDQTATIQIKAWQNFGGLEDPPAVVREHFQKTISPNPLEIHVRNSHPAHGHLENMYLDRGGFDGPVSPSDSATRAQYSVCFPIECGKPGVAKLMQGLPCHKGFLEGA